MNNYKKYFKDMFFSDLKKEAELAENPINIDKQIKTVFGIKLSGSLQAYLNFHVKYNSNLESGQFYAEKLFIPESDKKNVFKAILAGCFVGDLNQIFTDSILIGSDGGGQMYYAALDPENTEIYLYNHGVGEMKFLADSIEAYSYLNRIYEDWIIFEEENDIDRELIIDGEIPKDLDVSSFQEKLKNLQGHVNLTGFEDSDVCSEYDELFQGLMGFAMTAKPKSKRIHYFERSNWIMHMLDNCYSTPGHMEPKPESGKESISKSSDALYWLWRYYFMKNDEELKALCIRCNNHSARLVTDAVSLITELINNPDSFPEFNYIRIQRELLNNKNYLPVFKKIAPDFLEPEKTDKEMTAKHKVFIKENPENSGGWDNLAYNYYEEENWEKMLICSNMSLSIKPNFYYSWMQRGIALWMLKNFDEALFSFDIALCFDGNNDLWLNKAILLAEKGEKKSAFDHLWQIDSYNRAKIIKSQKDLDILSSEPEYKKLINP